jgi:hypothetical protein
MTDEPKAKGGYVKEAWIERYTQLMVAHLGWSGVQASPAARAAWDEAEADMTPGEHLSDAVSYMREDKE